ncbi:MAG: NfeD family protein [Hyphomicrobiaceae bacterium]|nr:NfeD family protein [Hyphomicrobiaceae bacterium]
MPLVQALAGLGAWNWLFLAVVLLGLEALVPGVHFVWFGVAAILIGLIGLATDLAWQWQLIGFAVLSVASVFVARRFARSDAQPSDTPDLNQRGHQYVGRVVTVEEPIRSGRGKVRVGDTVWQAEGNDQPAGARVKVTGARDTVLIVEGA